MTRFDIEEKVYQAHGGLTRKEIEHIVNTVFDLIKEAVVHEGTVKLKDFGVLEVVSRRGKLGRHPKTGQLVEVKPRKAVVFRFSRNAWGSDADGK